MKNETPASRSSRLGVILRLVAATVLCLVKMTIVLPNLFTYSNHQFSYESGSACCIAWMVSPLILIFVGAVRSRLVEEIGWTLLILVLAARFIGW
jgi:hypothetical protein